MLVEFHRLSQHKHPPTQIVCLRIVYADIGGILLTHTNTLFRGYKSKLFSLSKKSKSPIVRIPSSFRRGMMWSLTMIIFLKESSMLISDRDSCISSMPFLIFANIGTFW